MKNLQGKTRDIGNPYEIWKAGDWEWLVLKKYQMPKNEAKNPNARWFCAVKSPFTHGNYEYGDTYIKDIKQYALKVFDELDDTNSLEQEDWERGLKEELK